MARLIVLTGASHFSRSSSATECRYFLTGYSGRDAVEMLGWQLGRDGSPVRYYRDRTGVLGRCFMQLQSELVTRYQGELCAAWTARGKMAVPAIHTLEKPAVQESRLLIDDPSLVRLSVMPFFPNM